MHNQNRPRGFEDRLLHEFKNYFDERNQTVNDVKETPDAAPRFSRGKKFSLAGAVGAAALGIGAIVALPALTASAAYAVESTDDGKVHIEVHSPEDAQGLEAELADHGVKAKVDFTPEGMMCTFPHYTSDGGANWPEGESTSAGEGEFEIDVDPTNYPLDGDRTLVFTLSESYFVEKEGWKSAAYFSIGSAEGEVGECNPEPINVLPPEEGTEAGESDDGANSKNED